MGLGKEARIMATKDTKINNYCECLYSELSNIKDSLAAFVTQIELMDGGDKGHLQTHLRHLNELIENVDWKMEIFAKECPVDWSRFGKEGESSTSVPMSESMKDKDYPSGGYAGG
jgi:hypothetical protein